MSTKKNTGVRNHNTNMANTPAGSEVTGTPPSAALPAAVAPGIAPGITMALTASQLLGVEAKVKTFRGSLDAALAELYTALGVFPGPDKVRVVSVTGPRKQSAALYAGLLREYPDLASTVDPDVIDAGLAVNAALAMVKTDLQHPLAMVESSGRQAGYISCSDAAVIRYAAKGRARQDGVMAEKVATIDATLRHGKLLSTTADSATKAQSAAAKAQQKAVRAAEKAARAARVATRTAQAHADNHPLTGTGDVVIVPAGTTPKG